MLNVGPYKGQMIHGEVTNGGIKRVFVEKVNGQYQGAVFHFTQGLEAGVNRLIWGPDGALYVGGVGSTGNWSHANKLHYGLQKLTYNNKTAFEMLAVRAKSNGVEIEFTEPLKEGAGTKASDYAIRQWYYKPTENYGGPKLDDKTLPIQKVTLSSDRKKVFLQLAGMKPNHVVYVRLNYQSITSQSGQKPWVTETWYTMNNIPNEPSLLSNK
jgi:cytochrome c